MKILKLTRETAELQFSIDELLILKNSLLEAYHYFTVDDFTALIRGVSKNEALQLANLIENIIYCFPNSYKLAENNQFIQSIQLTKERIILHLTYKTILGLRGVLNVICHSAYIRIQDFKAQIGFTQSQISSFLDSIHYDVVEKMEEGSLEKLIFNKTKDISNDLNLKRHNLEKKSLTPQVTKECILKFESQQVVFLLTSLRNRKIFSGIRIIANKLSDPIVFIAKSQAQAIRTNDLVRLVAYLELALASEINNADLEKFTLSLFNSTGNPVFDIQVISRVFESKDKQYFNFCLHAHAKIQENDADNRYLDIRDSLKPSDIYFFTSSIKEFLSELPTKLDKQ